MTTTNTFSTYCSRDTHWFLTTGFSIIAMIAFMKHIDGDIPDQEDYAKWTFSAILITLALSGLSVLATLFTRKLFTDTLIEGAMSVVICGFWAGVLPTLMKAENELASDGFEVINPNLYFSSWGAFITSFFVLISYLETNHGEYVKFKPSAWNGLAMTSFVAMVAGSRLYKDLKCKDVIDDTFADDVCKRITLSWVLGAVSALIATFWSIAGPYMDGNVFAMMDVGFSVLVFIGWCFGVSYITFGDKAPAPSMGNLYFFSWGSFSLALPVAMTGVKNVIKSFQPEEEVVTTDTNVNVEDKKDEMSHHSNEKVQESEA